ncbi:MAG: RDD family protein [Cytophagales bacterium]|nr:RDD family protein [Cytophagales bacterium]
MSNDIGKEMVSRTNTGYAGFHPRMLAHNIDLLVLLPVFYLIGYFVEHNFLLFILCILLYIIYNTIFEMSSWRGTPGKRLQKIKVQADSIENEVTFKHALIRNAAKTLSALPFFYGFVIVVFDQKKRGLHDRMAKTVITFAEKSLK